MSVKNQILVFIILIALAAVMRFYRLGDWSFMGDEVYTIEETAVWAGDCEVPERHLDNGRLKPEETQCHRLPRLLPFAYLVHRLNFKLFGADEFGSRVFMAAIGSLNIGVVFLLAAPTFGRLGGLILSVMILCFPEQILNSQNCRFYSLSFFFISIIFLLGDHIVRKYSVRSAFWIGPAAVLLVFCNSFGGLIWGILLVSLAAQYFVAGQEERKRYSWKIFAWISAWSILLLGIAFFHIRPLASNWNDMIKSSGYTPLHALMAFQARLGWAVFLATCLGILGMLRHYRRPGAIYWATASIASFLTVFLLPLKIPFLPWYCFLFTFPCFAAAALFLEHVFKISRPSGPLLRGSRLACVLTVAALLNFPSLASYYCDGNRFDCKSACRFVRQHWQPGDRLSPVFDIARWYLCDLDIEGNRNDNGRVWIIVQYNRGAVERHLLVPLNPHRRFMAYFGKKRFDHVENNVVVLLEEP